MQHRSTLRPVAIATLALLLSACGGGDDDDAGKPEDARPQDARTFTADATATTFAAMTAQAGDTVDMSTTSR